MLHPARSWLPTLALLAALVWPGLPAPPSCRAAPPTVPVGRPVEREVTDHEDFTGRTEAARSVEVRARVTGYLDKVTFRDGDDVKQGQLLFEIDPRPYQAELDRATAGLAQAEARLNRLNADHQRARALRGRGAVTEEELAKIAAER